MSATTLPTCTLALDIGGTKIAFALVPDANPTTTIGTDRLKTKAGDGPLEQTRQALISGLAKAQELGFHIARVGIGAPGVILAPRGEIAYNGDTLSNWARTDLRGLVQEVLGVPLAVHNDVRIWAYGEHHLGAGQSLQGRVLYVSLGTGVGAAVIDNGELMCGPTGSAGEFAEIRCSDFAGRSDRCENIVSGTGLTKYYVEATGNPLELPDIMHKWHEGDELTRRIINGNLRGFGQALGALVTFLDLSAVVIGGGVSGIGAPVIDPISEGISDTILKPNVGVRVLTTSLGSDAAVLAAACYARDHAFL